MHLGVCCDTIIKNEFMKKNHAITGIYNLVFQALSASSVYFTFKSPLYTEPINVGDGFFWPM